MTNYFLKPVFKSIFDKEFQPNIFTDRLKMQKTIYILQNMGISVGDYKFMWYKHGPYSQTLQNDILNIKNTDNINIAFSYDAEKEITLLKNAIFEKTINYNIDKWIECLGSILYIKENLLPSSSSDKIILKELKERKPHLNNDDDNKHALQTLINLSI